MSVFLDKVAQRLDKLDSADRRRQFRQLADEIGFFESVFDTLREGVLVVSPAGDLLYANHAAETLTGCPCSKTRGKPIRKAIPGWDWDNLLQPARDGWNRASAQELEVLYPEHRILEINAMPSKNGTVVLVRDVTLARAREESERESSRTDAVRDLAAGVAHEIGNPLNALNIHLQLLSRELRAIEDEEQRASLGELVDVAKNEVVRLDAIIRQFLSAIRPAKPNLRPCDIVALIGEALGVMRVDIENRRIAVAVNARGQTPPALVDPDQIKQVVFNLVKNAMEAMPDGGRLEITVSADDAFLLLDFRDTGVGIPEEQLGRIFEPYHTTKAKGTGLGLMIVQRIVRDHGGHIEVSSKEGEGTCFRILLPRAERRVRKIADRR